MFQNALRAAQLDVAFYNEVEHDSSYTGQAAGVVVIASALSGIGSWLGPASDSLFSAVIGGVVVSLIGWVVWSGITLGVGKNFFGGTADMGEMLRVLGFATGPTALGIVPIIGSLVGGIWALVAGVVAIREGLDFSTGKAVGTVIVGWIAFVIGSLILSPLFF